MAATISNLQSPSAAVPELETPVLPPLAAGAQGRGSIVEIARLAAESLLANKTRSILTMLGVIIGVASVVALLAIGNGATASITSQVQSLGTNILTIRAGSPNNRTPGQSAGAQNLTLTDSNAIAALKLPITGSARSRGSSPSRRAVSWRSVGTSVNSACTKVPPGKLRPTTVISVKHTPSTST